MYSRTFSGGKRALSYWNFRIFLDGESGGGSDRKLFNHDFSLVVGLSEVLCATGMDSKVIGVSIVSISFPRIVVGDFQFFDSSLFY